MRFRSRRHEPIVGFIVLAWALVSAGVPNAVSREPAAQPASRDDAARRVMAVADEYVSESFIREPARATAAGVPDARHGDLNDNSLASIRAWQQKEDRWLVDLRAIDPESLAGTPAWVIYGTVRERLEAARDVRVCRDELWAVNHAAGWQTVLPNVAAAQPVATPELRALALSRFGKVPRYLDTEILNLREGLRMGFSAPKLTVELTIKQLDNLLAAPLERSPLFAPARKNTTPDFIDQWQRLMLDQLNPAIDRYRRFLRDEYLPAAREAIAASANPDGAACYRGKVRWFTTLDVDPNDLFAQQMAKLEKMDASIQQVAQRTYKASDVRSVLKNLFDDPDSRFRTREEAIAAAQALVKRAEASLPKLFARVPATRLVVEPVPAFMEATAPSRYNPAPDDGTRPAVFQLNVLQTMDPGGKLVLEQTAFHEGTPGHHLMGSLVRESTAHPAVRFWGFAGFGEGWATYAEQLAYEHDMYTSDAAVMASLSRRSLLFASNVAEIGIHIKGWSRQQAIDFRNKYSAFTPEMQGAMVDRRIAFLGQGHAYGVGASEVLDLREQAKRELGAKFDLREFHSRVLEDGIITLPMLREKIRRWIQAAR